MKHVVQFCEHGELLERKDEGMSMLLELNDMLDALQDSLATEDIDPSPPSCAGDADKAPQVETMRQLGDNASRPPWWEQQTALRED